jgi:RNA polymerase sigma-70 factor (ECF subfamily)
MVPILANGTPAVAQYKPSGLDDGRRLPWAIHLIEVSGDRISGITNFLDTRLFALFGLPAELTD